MCRKLFLLTSFVLLLGLAGIASASVMYEDFESYTDSNDMYNGGTDWNWVNVYGSGTFARYLDPNGYGAGDSNSIRMVAITDATQVGDGVGEGGVGGRSRGPTRSRDWSEMQGIKVWLDVNDADWSAGINGIGYQVELHMQDQGGAAWYGPRQVPIELLGFPERTTQMRISDPVYGIPSGGGYVYLPFDPCSSGANFFWRKQGTNGTFGSIQSIVSGGLVDVIRLGIFAWGTGTTAADDTYQIWFDDVQGVSFKAISPDPANNASIMSTSPTLSWVSGDYVQPTSEHEVYFADNFADVNSRAVSAVVRDVNNYSPAGLAFGVQYFWAVDEVNTTGPSHEGGSPWTGDVWSFTIGGDLIDNFESYTDTADMSATWTEDWNSPAPNTPPFSTFVQSLDTTGGEGGGQAMLLDWDPNTSEANGTAGTGYDWSPSKDWSEMAGIRIWVKAANDITTDSNYIFRVRWRDFDDRWSSVDLDLTDANFVDGKYVFIPWYDFYDHGGSGGSMQPENAERMYLRLEYQGTPPGGSNATVWVDNIMALVVQAYASNPSPATGTTGIPDITPTISWTAGDSTQDVNAHDVYLSSNWYSVHNAANSTDATYQGSTDLGDTDYIAGPLAYNTTYHWRIDEVNSAEANSPWRSTVWSLATGAWHNVDSFNDHLDDANMKTVWTAGADANMLLETATIGGNATQSMYIDYNSPGGDCWVSRAPESTDEDWTMSDTKVLQLYFYGDTGNTALPLYVRIKDGDGNTATIVHSDPNAVKLAPSAWPRWWIDLEVLAGTGSPSAVDLTDIVEIRVGVSGGATSGTNVIWIDGIRLYPTVCITELSSDYDINGDCEVNLEDFALFAIGWGDDNLWP